MLTTNAVTLTLTKNATALVLAMLISAFPAVASASSTESGDCKVVVLGASYAKDWPVSRVGSFRVINRGIDGNQSFEMAERFIADVIDQDTDAVIIWGFINDFFRSPPDRANETGQRILDSYTQMIGLAKEHDVIPLIATEVSIREPGGFMNWIAGVVGRLRGKISYQETINRNVVEMNVAIQKLAAKHGIQVYDFHKLLSDEDGLRRQEFATEDGSHISAPAYAELTNYVSEKFTLSCQARK